MEGKDRRRLAVFASYMKIATIVAAIVGLFGVQASAAVIYDDFTNPTNGSPSEDLWHVVGNSSDVLQADGMLTMTTSSSSVGILSTASFGYGSFIFQFSDSPNTSYRGFGIAAGGDPSDDRILLRDDTLARSLRLDVFTNGEYQVNPADALHIFTYGPDDIWEFQYLPNHLVLIQNGVTVFSESVSLTTDPVQISAFAYSGGSMQFDSIAVTPIPEPSTITLAVCVIAMAGTSTLLRKGRQRNQAL